MRIVRTTILVSLASGICAQQTELSGRVIDSQGRAVADAEITFSLLAAVELRGSGVRGAYGLAQRRHIQSLGSIVSASDETGRWQRQLTATEAAILTVAGNSYRMEVRARGFMLWSRAIAGDLRGDLTKLAQLERGQRGATLEVVLEGGERPYQGYALIERQFRIHAGGSIWLPSLEPLTQRGAFRFDQPPRIPGEILAPSPTARAEVYRVSIYAVGLQPIVRTLPVGSWRLPMLPSPAALRPVLDPDGKPATTPIRATYILGGQEVEVKFSRSHVALLGDRPPTRVGNSLGEARVSVWNPLQAIHLGAPRSRNSEQPRPDPTLTRLTLRVVDRRGRPASGCGIWLEDDSVRKAKSTAEVFAVTDSLGTASLENLPRGIHRVLLRHPSAGWRELQLRLETGQEQAVLSLLPPIALGRQKPGLPGTLLLDMGERGGMFTELGFITTERRLVRTNFADRPRWIRLEGLPMGAISLYVRSENEPAVLVAGVLSGTFNNPPFKITEIKMRHLRLSIRDVEGHPLGNAAISFGEGPTSSLPYTSGLITLQKGKRAGDYFFEAPIHGSPLMRIHDRDGGYQDVVIPVRINEGFLEVVVGGK